MAPGRGSCAAACHCVRQAFTTGGATKSGVIDADTTLKLDTPETRVLIDRARAADLVHRALQHALARARRPG